MVPSEAFDDAAAQDIEHQLMYAIRSAMTKDSTARTILAITAGVFSAVVAKGLF